MNCELIIESGAYVLGILEADERAAYERHLRTCAICRAEVADFAGLPDMLAQLGPDQAAAIGRAPFDAELESRYEASDHEHRRDDSRHGGSRFDDEPRYEAKEPVHLRPLPSVPRSNPAEEFVSHGARVSRGAQRRQRRWRVATAALAAAACLAVGVLVGARFIDNGPVATPSDKNLVAMQPVSASVPINAQVALNPFIGGTAVRMHCVYSGGQPAPRWTLKLFVYPKDGSAPEQVSTWTAAHGDDLTLSAATRLTVADIKRVELRKGDDTPLLEYETA